MRRAAFSFLLMAAATACSGKPSATLNNKPPRPPIGLNAPSADMARDLEATVLEGYSQLTLDNLEAYRDSFLADPRPEVIGVIPQRTMVDQPPEALPDPRLFPSLEPDLLSKNLDVHVSSSAPVGWVYDEVSYRINYEGRAASIPIRRTAVYVVDGGRWALAQEHLSYPQSVQEASLLAAAGRLPVARRVAPFGVTSEAGRELAAVITRLPLASGQDRESIFSSADYALMLYPGQEGEFSGPQVRQAPRLAALFGPAATVTVSDVRVHPGPGRKVAWGMCTYHVRGFLGARTPEQEITLRASVVLEQSAEYGWQIVQAHLSTALSEPLIQESVMGGTGVLAP